MRTFISIVGASYLLLLASAGRAQTVTGTTTVDLDPQTGMITATCETDLDADAQAYYGAQVTCALKDGDDTVLAVGNYADHQGALGYAQVVLTYQGVPGNIYFATGTHLGFLTLGSDPVEGQPQTYFDYYNIAAFNDYFLEGNSFFPTTYSFTGPGPQQERRSDTVKGANTVDQAAYPLPSATVAIRFAGNISANDGQEPAYFSYTGTDALGLLYGTLGNQPGCVVGDELVGTVSPATAPGPFTVKRVYSSGLCYTGTAGQTPALCAGKTPPTDDTGNAVTRTPASGQVFNIDIPGIRYTSSSTNITRQRVNFTAYVVGADGKTVISPAILFNVRLSCKNPTGLPSLSTDVTGDNSFGMGTTSISWNLLP